MKQAVKTLALITISIALTTSVFAQLKLPLATAFAADIKKVINDYPNNFKNLIGELIIEHPQSADYACNFKIAGAEEATVTKYSAKRQDIASWQATMITTEDFEEAKKKFHSIYNQLNNISIQAGSTNDNLKGKFELPVEEKKFTSVILSPQKESLKKLKVEIVMLYEPMEWKVKVMVYNREREDFEKGNTTEE